MYDIIANLCSSWLSPIDRQNPHFPADITFHKHYCHDCLDYQTTMSGDSIFACDDNFEAT